MNDALQAELDMDHAYLMSVESTMFSHLRFYIVTVGAVFGALAVLIKYFWDANQLGYLPAVLVLIGSLFFGIVYFGLFVYLELRVRKIKMLEQIAVIRGKIKADEPAIADNFILITHVAQCPPYLRTGCSEWYTVVFLCLLWGL